MTAHLDADLAHRLALLRRREARLWAVRRQLLADVREDAFAASSRGDAETVVALTEIETTLAHALEYGVSLCPVLSTVVIDTELREPWRP